MNILFVCTANISRSFLSEKLFKYELQMHKLSDIQVSSAGVMALSGSPPDPKMVDYLDSLGIPSDGHQSRQLDKEIVARADRILVMEKNHYHRIEAAFPEAIEKVELFGKYVSPDASQDDIVDPFGRSSYHYRLSQSQIQMAVEGLINSIQFNI
jgi:protein-tyrosine phosphatase